MNKHDPHSAAATNLLRGLHEVQIRSFIFSADHIYRRTDIEQLTSKLMAPDWRHVVQVRDGRTNEYVDVDRRAWAWSAANRPFENLQANLRG